MKEPTIQVPVSVFLDLARTYMLEPQELVNRQSYEITHQLNKKAYRKFQGYRKALMEMKRR